jgi:hypothetical protein
MIRDFKENYTWVRYNNSFPELDYLPDECDEVIVLGAGASMHLGYPSGIELKNNIIVSLKNIHCEEYETLLKLDFSNEEIKKFCETLEISNCQSIDSFLEKNNSFLRIGKITIAQHLVKHENRSKLQDNNSNWYMLLWERIKYLISLNRYPPLIINFNYDISLFQFLFDSVQKEKDNINYSPNNIIPVHGSLALIEEEDRNYKSRTYGNKIQTNNILKISQGIKVWSEISNDHGKGMVNAKYAISNSKRVVFLGFGFHETNMRRLGLYDVWENKPFIKFHATGYMLNEATRNKLTQIAGKQLMLGNNRVNIIDYLNDLDWWRS